MSDTIIAGLLGLLEGLTEFIPVSSTGHILLAGHFLGFNSAGKTFEVLIQLGAILAILGVYAQRLIHVFASAPRDPAARRFILSVLIAFLPAAVIGVLAHGIIKTILFETAKAKFFDEYLEKLSEITDIRKIDYLVVNHTEPDGNPIKVRINPPALHKITNKGIRAIETGTLLRLSAHQ